MLMQDPDVLGRQEVLHFPLSKRYRRLDSVGTLEWLHQTPSYYIYRYCTPITDGDWQLDIKKTASLNTISPSKKEKEGFSKRFKWVA